jgi:hypothetical protein
MNELEKLFLAAAEFDLSKLPACRTCVHRKRFALNEYSLKVIQCCELQRSKRSNSGYKTIKITDKACNMYQELTAKN